MRSKGTQTMADKRDLLYNLKIGDKFTTTRDKNKVFQIINRKGDTTYVKEVATGKDSWFEYPDTFVIPVDESATYQKKRFKEPAYMYESVSSSKIKSSDDLYEWMTEYMRKHGSNRFTSLQFILGNGNNIIIAWDMKSYKGIHEGSKDYTMTEFVYKFMEPIIQNSGISSIYEADMDTGRFKPVKESFVIQDSNSNNKPVYFHYGKFTGYDWGYEKDKATKFSTKEKAEQMIEKMRQEGALIKDMKIVQESQDEDYVIKQVCAYAKPETMKSKGVTPELLATAIGDYIATAPSSSDIFNIQHFAKILDRIILSGKSNPNKFILDKVQKNCSKLFESRIAKGYENLTANEKAKHLLSHPCSKYMSDLKTGNITERAIRKAVKEMLGKPDKDDPQFIIDVNEECGKVQESFLIVGKLPYDDLQQAYISYSDKGIDIYTPEYKKHATRFSSRQEAQKVLDLMKKEGWKTEKFEIVQEEGEAPATSTANVANPELPLKLKESLSSKTHKFKPEELKVGKKVIDKVGGKEVHGKITVNHHDLYKDNPYTQDKKGSTVVTIVTDSGRSYDVDANDNGGEFILEGCKKKKVVEDKEVPIWTLKKGDKFRVTYDTNIHKAGDQLFKVTNVSDKYVDAISDDNVPYYWTNMTTKVIKESCRKQKVVEGYTVIFPTGSSEKLKTIADVNKFVNGVLKMMGKKASNVQLTDATLDKWNKENDIPLVIVKEDDETLENHFKYQISVAGGMSSDPETCENAKEHEEATSLVESIIKKSVRKKLNESVGQKLNITLIRKPQNMKEVEDDMRKGHGDRVKAIVDKSYKLSANEYDKFVYNFMVHTTYLSGEGGVDSDGTVHVVEITAPGKKTIYVDPEGYDYARYVGW